MSRFIEYSNNIFFDVMLTVWRNVERRETKRQDVASVFIHFSDA